MNAVSMTGFGRGAAQARGLAVRVEARSVNGRVREVHVRSHAPDLPLAAEDEVRRLAEGAVRRGRVEVRIEVTASAFHAERAVQEETARAYARRLDALARTLGLRSPVTLDLLVRLPGVVSSPRLSAHARGLLSPLRAAAGRALSALRRSRAREGTRLVADVRRRLAGVAREAARARALLPQVTSALRDRLRRRVSDALAAAGASADEGRLLSEATVAAQKADVAEEVLRLHSHLAEAARALAAGGELGRKLDFLAQEMLREVQTLASKAGDARLSRCALRMKEGLDRVREQAQNLE